jgi:Family of unknown function (DUF5683)
MNVRFLMRMMLVCLLAAGFVKARAAAVPDTVPAKTAKAADTAVKKQPHSPKIALRRSALVPGWGQAYNKQYWKIPIVYGALGVTAGIFVYNLTWYKKCRFAFNARSTNNTADIAKIDSRIKDLSITDLSFYRRQFRQNADYSVLFFAAAWGLNILDAVVFAHLKDFDVSDDLSIRLNAGHNAYAGTTGLTLSFDLEKKKRNAR